MSTLPTTRAELRPWLDKQLKKRRPSLTKTQREEILSMLMGVIYSDAEVPSFIEGWEAARTNKVDPERVKSSIESMKRNGRI